MSADSNFDEFVDRPTQPQETVHPRFCACGAPIPIKMGGYQCWDCKTKRDQQAQAPQSPYFFFAAGDPGGLYAARYAEWAEMRKFHDHSEIDRAYWWDKYSALPAIPEPGFNLDSDCFFCCHILDEMFAATSFEPTRAGYRCPRHRNMPAGLPGFDGAA